MPTVSKGQVLATEIAIHAIEQEMYADYEYRGAVINRHLIKLCNELRRRVGADDLLLTPTTEEANE